MSAEDTAVHRGSLIWVVVPVAAVLGVVSAGLNWGRPLLDLHLGVLLVVFVVGQWLLVLVGALIAARRSRNPIGWLLLAVGLLLMLAFMASGYGFRTIGAGALHPWSTLANWAASWLVVVMWALVGFITLLFPDGRLPSARWRWFARTFATFGLLYVAVAATTGWPRRREIHADLTLLLPSEGDDVTAALWPAFAALLAVTLGALVVRYRHGGSAERAQIRWLGLAGTAALAATVLFGVERLPELARVAVGMIASFAPPVAVGVAVLRYRLYEIDRIIARTVTYGLVVLVLATVYTVGVVVVGTALAAVTGDAGGRLVVAGSTLAAVAVFRPARARVHAVVDRRFNRTGYRSRQAVDRFPDRIRDEVDLETLRGVVATTARLVVQPAAVSVWLADAEGTRTVVGR